MDRVEYISLDVLIMYLMNEFNRKATFEVKTISNNKEVKVIIKPVVKEPINNIDFLKFYAECEENKHFD